MNIVNRMFKRNKFPDALGNGEVQLVGDKLICKGHSVVVNFDISLHNLQYVYLVLIITNVLIYTATTIIEIQYKPIFLDSRKFIESFQIF